ncbi:hypothetical protein FSP39_013725 [Pinctada imbricata]|uniref:RING-type domain-containing protein n=1 Tax=Pinctada imbricata TaxID=66713 RepID=A0AA89BR77_PINIB|nr:hypothetical protein FSP39_013725 [Pinctada imbricata]
MASGGGPHRPPSSRRPYSISKDEAFARQLQEEEEVARLQDSEDENNDQNNSDNSDSTVEENVPPRSTAIAPVPSTRGGLTRGRARAGNRRASHGMRPTETEVVTPSTTPTTSTSQTNTTNTTTPRRGVATRGRSRGTRPRRSRGRGRGTVTTVTSTVQSDSSSSDEAEDTTLSAFQHTPRSMEPSVPPISLALNRPELPRGETEPEILLVDRGTNNDARFIHIMRDPMLLILFLMGRRPDLLVPDDVDPNDYEALWELAERMGEVKNRGLEENDLKKLPTKKFTSPKKVLTEDHDGPQCRVCLSSYKTGDNLCTLPCKHEFHAACVKEWLKRNASCPICRHDLKNSN